MHHNGLWQTVNLEAMKHQGSHIIVKLKDCQTIEQARTYVNNPIAANRSQFVELPQGDYYWVDLIGLNVINHQGIELGIVDHLFETGANDVLVVQGKKRHLLPYTAEVIQSINLKQKIILVQWDIDF